MIGVYITLEYKLFSDIMIIKISSISFKTIDDFLEFYVPSKKIPYLFCPLNSHVNAKIVYAT